MFFLRGVFLLAFCCFINGFVKGQSAQGKGVSRQSVKAELPVILYKILGYRRINKDSTLHYGRMLYQKGLRVADPYYTAEGAYTIGLALGETQYVDSAAHFLEIARQGFQSIDSTDQIVFVSEALARIYTLQGRQELALDRLNIAMRCAEESGDSSNLSKVYHRVASIHHTMGNYALAITETRKSLAINLALGTSLAVSVNYNTMGSCLIELGELDSARFYLQKSLEIKEKVKDLKGIGLTLNNMALLELKSGDDDKADALLDRAILIGKKTGVGSLLAMGKINQGYAALQRGDPARAIAILLAAAEMPEVASNLNYRQELSSNLSIAYAALGDFAAAYRHQQTFLTLSDSLKREEMSTRILGLQNEVEEQRHRRDMAALNAHSENQALQIQNRQALILVLGVVVMLVLALALLLWLRYRIRTRESERLNALNQLKSRFFSNISHEFKTPLSLILGPLDKLQASTEPGSEERVLYALMQRNARQLLDLNNQLLDLARLESGKMPIRSSEMPWAPSLRGTASAFLPDAQRREVQLDIRVEDLELEALADRTAFEKIINNLLSNALKHTPGGGQVLFSATLERAGEEIGLAEGEWRGAHTLITVRDSGKGIPQDDLDRIFDRFYQVESARQAGTPGTGIGLALVRELVQVMDGEVQVESRVGVGTTFHVRLPVQVRPGGQASSPPFEQVEQEQTGASEPGALPRLLIVEDNEELRAYMRQEFAIAFEVTAAENGRIGLEMAIDETPDMIISDLMMPEMDGIALCAAIKSNPATSHVPFILLTALGTVEDRVRGLEEGADDYLQKPFHTAELIARARNLLEQRRVLRRLWSQPTTSDAELPAPSLNRLDQEFLERAMATTREHMADPEYSVETFAREMHMSRPQLFRKIKALTDQNLSEFIRTVRLREAGRLFSENFGNVTEVLYAVGFNNSSYFSKCFREMYGEAPSDYAEQFRSRPK